MAAQHKEVMEERVLNGLRMPSPAPKVGEGRIAAVANSHRALALDQQRSTLSRLAPTFTPSSWSLERRGRSRGRGYFWSDVATRGSEKKSVSVNVDRSPALSVHRRAPVKAQSDDEIVLRTTEWYVDHAPILFPLFRLEKLRNSLGSLDTCCTHTWF